MLKSLCTVLAIDNQVVAKKIAARSAGFWSVNIFCCVMSQVPRLKLLAN